MSSNELTPPNIFDVSRRLARELVDLYERFDGQAVPLIAYRASFLHRDQDGHWRDGGPYLGIERADSADIPINYRRWSLGGAYAIAIPEGIWRNIAERMIDFDANGLTIVLKTHWDQPGVRPPALIDRSFSDVSNVALSQHLAEILAAAYEANGRTLAPTLVYCDPLDRRELSGPMIHLGGGFELQFTSLHLIPPECVGRINGIPFAAKIPARILETSALHLLDDCMPELRIARHQDEQRL